MASLVLSGDTSGSITVSAPAVAGSTTQTLVNVTGTLAPIVSGTAVTCAGQTSIDFTGIPSWVKRITVMFQGVSTSGTSIMLVQLGTSGGVVTSGYVGGSSGGNTGVASSAITTGHGTANAMVAASTYFGHAIFTNISGNTWVGSSAINQSAGQFGVGGSGITLGGTLDRVRITTVNGTDTFDTTPSAGTINIIYE